MNVRGASRAGGTPPGQDRWAATAHSVIVLDGASAFDPAAPPADHYVDALLAVLVDTIDQPTELTAILQDAIAKAAADVHAEPGAGPSSTIAIVRQIGDGIEAAVLGDSTIAFGLRNGATERLTDERIGRVAAGERAAYRARLAGGSGYDETHRAVLSAIQAAERAARNQLAGYWIAEADPAAGAHALTRRFLRDEIAWVVLATDGAQRGFDRERIDWSALPGRSSEDLAAHLDDLQRWEHDQDPDGALLPRAKRHDDKTVVTWTAPRRP